MKGTILTGREELHSINEELEVNVDELSQSNSNLQNLMASSEVATIILDLAFLTVKKLLFNLVKHSSAKEAFVELAVHDFGTLRVTVRDGGQGFDPTAHIPHLADMVCPVNSRKVFVRDGGGFCWVGAGWCRWFHQIRWLSGS